jgi:hypothetical protein
MKRVGIGELAERLIRDGYVDNETDARLAALKIILALDDFCAATDHAATDHSPGRADDR